MAKRIGRSTILSKGSTPVAGVRVTGVTVNNETINFTDQNSDGWQELSEAVGERNVEITVSGIYVDDDMLDLSLGESIQDDFTLTSGTRTLTGTFNITSYEEGDDHTEEGTFDATLTSSGEVVKGTAQ